MALHNLKIVVVDGGRSYSYKSKNAGVDLDTNTKQNYKDTPLYKLLNAKKTIMQKFKSGMTPASVFAMNMGIGVAKQVLSQTANYYLSDIGRKNGDTNYQAMINRQIEQITDPMSFIASALSGAATGSMFGGVGAGVGLALGAASSAISLGFKYMERERQYQHIMFQQNNSQAYNLSRSGFQCLTGRLR